MKELDCVMTPYGIGRVETIYPAGVLGKHGDAPNVKVSICAYGQEVDYYWFHEDKLKQYA